MTPMNQPYITLNDVLMSSFRVAAPTVAAMLNDPDRHVRVPKDFNPAGRMTYEFGSGRPARCREPVDDEHVDQPTFSLRTVVLPILHAQPISFHVEGLKAAAARVGERAEGLAREQTPGSKAVLALEPQLILIGTVLEVACVLGFKPGKE